LIPCPHLLNIFLKLPTRIFRYVQVVKSQLTFILEGGCMISISSDSANSYYRLPVSKKTIVPQEPIVPAQRDQVFYAGNGQQSSVKGYGYRVPDTTPTFLSKSNSATISLITEDGDVVSISRIAVASQVREYSYTGRPDLARGSETFSLNSKELSDYSISTKGELSKEEQRDIEKVLQEFKPLIDKLFDSSLEDDVSELGMLTKSSSLRPQFYQAGELVSSMNYMDNRKNQRDAHRLSLAINKSLKGGEYQSLAFSIAEKHSDTYFSKETTITSKTEPVSIFGFSSESDADSYYLQQNPDNIYNSYSSASRPVVDASNIMKSGKERVAARTSALYASVQALKASLGSTPLKN
jgi:hypothetical protein